MDARKNAYRFAAIATVGAAALLLVAAPAEAQADPPGNNGTVKIDAAPFDDLPDNEPHDPCVFQVDFYGFDAGVLDATVTFTAVPPTAAGQDLLVDTVPIGEDAAGGGTDLDASRTYDLTALLAGIDPHPQQGFHVRLTVHADGSRGADTKFKEFWVGPCGETPPTTAPPTTGGPPTTPIEPGSGPGTPPGTPPGGGPGSHTPPDQTPDATITPSASTATAATGTLPDTGSNALPLVAAGLALAGLGAGIVLAARTRRMPH